MINKKQTSPQVASMAGYYLADPNSSAKQKSIDASALSQAHYLNELITKPRAEKIRRLKERLIKN